MRDRLVIFTGLLLFVALFTYPMWRSLLAGATPTEPILATPLDQRSCVATREFMRNSHMQLLRDWRTGFVREGRRSYKAASGMTYSVSLTNTCLTQCHGDKAEFCDRCHNYVALAQPNCWECHQNSTFRNPKTSVASLLRPTP